MAFLPTELLVHICTYLRDPCSPEDGPFSSRLSDGSQRTLASLCLTSKRFHAIAEPLLYLEMQPRERAAIGDSKIDRLQDWNAQLASFVRTLERRSDLAALVKRITVNAYFAFTSAMKTQMWTHPLVTMDDVIRHLPSLEQYSLDFRGSYKLSSSPDSKREFDVFSAAFPLSFGDRDGLEDLMRSGKSPGNQ
jgi:hypothetical protein